MLLASGVACASACAVDRPWERGGAADTQGRVGTTSLASIADGRAESVFGQPDLTHGEAPRAVTVASLDHPTGLAFADRLYVADTGSHRVFAVDLSPFSAVAVARSLRGQETFSLGEANRGGPPSSLTLSAPSAVSIAYAGNFGWGSLAIADAGNHRALLYDFYSIGGARAVLGQITSFTTAERNRGGISARSLAAPGGLAAFQRSLFVSDTENHRVLEFDGDDDIAKRVHGQADADFEAGLPNRGGAVGRATLNRPMGLARRQLAGMPAGELYVADSGNNRVLKLIDRPSSLEVAAVYGQGDSFDTGVASKGGVSASSLSTPTAVAIDPAGGIYVADTGHHRVLHFKRGSTVADRVYGQPSFVTGASPKATSATTLSSPMGVAVGPRGDLYVADTGASRVVAYPFVCLPDICDDGNPCTDDSCVDRIGCINRLVTFPKDCAGHACTFATEHCEEDCRRSRCGAGYLCTSSGKCRIPCTTTAQCMSGTSGIPGTAGPCVDGWCCDRGCSGDCEACNLPGREGVCSPVRGAPVNGKRCSTGDPGCMAGCNGLDGDTCQPKVYGAACGVHACRDGVALKGGTCDGAGTCEQTSGTCGAYACASNGCRTSCDRDADCSSGARCVEGACVVGGDVAAVAGNGCELRGGRYGRGDASADGAQTLALALATAAHARRRASARRAHEPAVRLAPRPR